MIRMFAGLTAANLILLLIVFGLGLSVNATDAATRMYPMHMAMGFAAGLMVLLAHLSVFMYFMATSKWLAAASVKVGIADERFIVPAQTNKRRAFGFAMAAIVITMLTMFAGAGADPTLGRLWPAEVHLIFACVTIAANVIAAMGEYRLIRGEGQLMDQALGILQAGSGVEVKRPT